MAFDYSKLRGKIIELFGTQAYFAAAMGWSERTLSLKIKGVRAWKQPAISKALTLLNLPDKNIQQFFFKPKFKNIKFFEEIT